MPKTVNIPGVGRVNFPDSMTPEQITTAIEQDILPNAAPSRGRGPAPTPLGGGASAMTTPEKPTAWERFGAGASDVVDRLAQLTIAGGEALGLKGYPEGLGDVMTAQSRDKSAEYEKGRGPDAGFDAMRTLGGASQLAPLALLPGGAPTALGRAGAGALAGGVGGFLQFDPTNSLMQTAKNTAIGAGTGAVLAPLIGYGTDKLSNAAGSLVNRARGTLARWQGDASPASIMQAIPEISSAPPEVQRDLIREAQEQIKQFGGLNAEALARKANLVANGVTPTKSMVTRSPRDFTMERNLQKLAQSPDEAISGVGQELTGIYQANDQALAGRLGALRGPARGTDEALGMKVMDALDDLATRSQKEVGDLYEIVRQTKGNQLASDARNLASTLDDLKDNTYAEKLVSSVTNKLRRFGMLDQQGNLTSKSLTVTDAEELRKFVNKLPNDFGKRDIIRAIDADVLQGMGEDAFSTARGAAAARFSMLNNPATQRALNTYGELTQGKTAQNFIRQQVVSGSEQDVATLLRTLKELPEKEAGEALDALRAGVLQHLESKAINPNSGKFSGAALSNAMRDVGEGKLRDILGADFPKLQSLARAALDATYEPAYSAVNHSGTAPMLLSLVQRGRSIPGVPLIVNENVEKMAARAGYRGQLAEALQARAPGTSGPMTRRTQELVRSLGSSAGAAQAPLANAIMQERRKKSGDDANRR